MHPKSPKFLEDVVRSCQYIVEDTEGETLDTYLDDRRPQQVVERNLEIIGEALVRLTTVDPESAALVTDLHRIIGLCNRLAHGYDEEIDDIFIWRTVQESLPTLRAQAERLLPAFEP